MQISKELSEDIVNFAISGRIDTSTAEEFQEKVDEEIECGAKKIHLDFSGVEYVSSAGLRAILYLNEKLSKLPEGEFLIKNVNSVVMEVFEMTGFSDLLKINSCDEEGTKCQNS